MKSKTILTIASATWVLAIFWARSFSRRISHSVKVPDGLALSEFRG